MIVGDKVFENYRYWQEGRSNFGSSLRRFNGEVIEKIQDVEAHTNFLGQEVLAHKIFILSNGMMIGDMFVAPEPYIGGEQ